MKNKYTAKRAARTAPVRQGVGTERWRHLLLYLDGVETGPYGWVRLSGDKPPGLVKLAFKGVRAVFTFSDGARRSESVYDWRVGLIIRRLGII